MINDDTFRAELDSILKRRKVKKADRNEIISRYQLATESTRDAVLDSEELLTREYEREQDALKHIPSEFKEQCDFVAWFKQKYPEIMIMSIRNHGSRTPRERSEQMMEGLQPGAADLFIPAKKLWIEMKRVKGGRQSDEQVVFADYVTANGYQYHVCFGSEEAKKICCNL